MVGEEEESVEAGRCGAKLGGVAFSDHGLRSQAFDPGEWSGVGEAEVVGEEEEKVLVVGVGFEELSARFG